MSFNIALSGLKAASGDLQITGNNIANASTPGFKRSRAEFGALYASSMLGAGPDGLGNGVRLQVSQQFDQGTVSFTSNSLDLAIDGSGFFILSDDGVTSYTRAGIFGIDDDGFVVNNNGLRLQGFDANDSGTINGFVGDIQISAESVAPRQTTEVRSSLNLESDAPVLARYGTTIATAGESVGTANTGQAVDTPSVVNASAPPVAFDFSVNNASAISGVEPITPFDFSADTSSAVTAPRGITGFNFGVNTATSLTAMVPPGNFDFASRATAVTAASGISAFDFSQAGASASFDVTIAGGSGAAGDVTRTITLSSNITNITELLADINDDLSGIDVLVRENPAGSGTLEFAASLAGEPSTVTIDNFTAGGAGVTAADVVAALGGITDGATSSGTYFDITLAGSGADGTVRINLNGNITSIRGLLADIQDQLTASAIPLSVQQDPNNSGRLQFVADDTGVASQITVSNYTAGSSDTTIADLASVLRIAEGASSPAAGSTALGHTGSLTRSTFDVSIGGGSGSGGNRSVTLVLDQSIASDDLAGLVDSLNAQLEAVPGQGIDVRARENPRSAGQLQFYATVTGESSTVTVDNFQTSGIAGEVQASAADISAMLGGIVDGAADASGVDTSASFQLSLQGGANGVANRAVTVTRL